MICWIFWIYVPVVTDRFQVYKEKGIKEKKKKKTETISTGNPYFEVEYIYHHSRPIGCLTPNCNVDDAVLALNNLV